MIITKINYTVGNGWTHPNKNYDTEFNGLFSNSYIVNKIDLHTATITFHIINWINQAK